MGEFPRRTTPHDATDTYARSKQSQLWLTTLRVAQNPIDPRSNHRGGAQLPIVQPGAAFVSVPVGFVLMHNLTRHEIGDHHGPLFASGESHIERFAGFFFRVRLGDSTQLVIGDRLGVFAAIGTHALQPKEDAFFAQPQVTQRARSRA